MNITNEDKKKIVQFAVIAGVALGCVYFLKPTARKSMKVTDDSMKELPSAERQQLAVPVVDEASIGMNPKSDEAHMALAAYIQAYNEGVDQDELDTLNKEFVNEFGLRVVRRRSDDKLVVKDLNDKEVMVYSG